jgi:hypothetical protein
MTTGYSRSPKFLKGALIHFSAPMLVPIPNVIIFQYNPETMTRTLTPWKPREQVIYKDDKEAAEGRLKLLNELAQPFDPDESFSLTLELDASDALEQPLLNPLALVAGVSDRIAALEMLCYPPGVDQLNSPVNLTVTVNSATATAEKVDRIPRLEVPIVLFIWGAGRIVPVRITTFSVEEQQYSPLLYPVRAKVSLGLSVLSETHLLNVAGEQRESATVKLARACYQYTQAQKRGLAAANLANSVNVAENIIGMLSTI